MAPPLIFKTKKTMAIRKQNGPGPKKAKTTVVKAKSPSAGSGNPFTGSSKRKSDPYDSPVATARRANASKEIAYDDFFQKTSRAKKGADYASSREYGGAFAPSKVLEKDNMYRFASPSKAGVAKKINTTKAPAAGTASKKDVKSYKKTMRKK